MPEAHFQVESGPRAGTVIVVVAGDQHTLGSDPRCNTKLPDLDPYALTIRFRGLLEVQPAASGVVKVGPHPLPPNQWYPIRAGDVLEVGPYSMRADVHGLDDETRFATAGTRRISTPEKTPAGYTVKGRLGAGGFGTVYSATRDRDGQEVALKVLHRPPLPRVLRRFEREAAACAQFDHPNMVRVIEVGIDQHPPFVAMELIDGPSVHDLLASGGLPVAQALRIAMGVASALAAIAEAGFVHRDLKPANILVATDDVAKVVDFGLAKDLSSRVSTLTATGVALGTLAYMSPEQLRDAKRVTSQADVYSLGATLYHMLAGRPPFHLTSVKDVYKVLKDEPPPLDRPGAPRGLGAIVRAMLGKEPDDRPAAKDLIEPLEEMARRAAGGDHPSGSFSFL